MNDFYFDPLSSLAIITACIISGLSTLILSKNSALNHYGQLRYPILALTYFLCMASYLAFATTHLLLMIVWYFIVGSPTFYLHYEMFRHLKKEVKTNL